jgi:hypothetical protein
LWLLALVPRLVDLGGFLTIDEIKWIEGAGQFTLALRSGDLAQTYWHFFPGITITWGETLFLWLGWLLNGGDLATYIATQVSDPGHTIGLFRLSGALWTSLCAPGAYLLGRRVLDDWSAALAGGLIALDPFLLAHSRIVNGDASAAGLMLLSLLAFLALWQGSGWRTAALSGALGGLALLTKLPAPLIGPFVGCLAVAGWWRDRRTVFWLKALLIWGVMAALVFVVLWPAMWVDPVGTLQRMLRDTFEVGEAGEGHATFYRGQVVNDPGWGFYPYAVAFRLTPVVLVGLLLLPLLYFTQGRQSSPILRHRSPALILIVYVLYIYVFSSLSPKKLDRYVMALFPALDGLAALGYAQITSACRPRQANLPGLPARAGKSPRPAGQGRQISNHLKFAFWLLIIGVLAMAFVMPNYPYYLSYYNPLLGGIQRAVREVPVGWGEGLEQAAAWLNDQPDADHLRVAAWYSDIFFPYFVGERVSFSSNGKSQLTADYVVFYVNQVQRQTPDPGLVAYFQAREPAYVVRFKGVEWAWVYPGPHMAHPVTGETQIEGRAWLLGYSLADNAQPGNPLPITLYFRVLGNLPVTETFDVRLAAGDGRLLGEWRDAGRPNGWTANAIVEWHGSLSLPADLPPGLYRLDVGLRATDSGERFARFQWPAEDEGWLKVTSSTEGGG